MAARPRVSTAESFKREPPLDLTSLVDAHTPVETLRLAEAAGVAKARLSWLELSVKSFLAGIFISLGAGLDILIAGGSPGLRASNPSLATLISALTFPVGFVIIILTNTELCTSDMFVMPYSTLRRRTSIYDMARNLIVSYVMNIAGYLFYAGVLFSWAGVLTSDAQIKYASTQAEGRANVNWGFNVTKGIMCNWLVALAFFFATQGRDNLYKIVGIWIAIACFVAMGYQHCIANFFLIPISMFYCTNFSVGKFIWASVIPVTIGNLIGGGIFGSLAMWTVYGRHEASVRERQDDKPASKV